MTPAVEQFVTCEVRRQLTRRGVRVGPGQRLRRYAGLGQEPGDKCMTDEEHEAWRKKIEEGKGHWREAKYLDDILGRVHLKQRVCKMSQEMNLPDKVRDNLYKMTEGYSHKWTVVDLLNELEKALEGSPPTINANLVKERMKLYWGTVPRSKILKGKRGFGTRLIESFRNFYWWEILGMALAGSAVAVIGYKYIEEKAFGKEMKDVGALS